MRRGGTKLSNWQTDKKWSDRFMPEIKSIIGMHLIGPAPYEDDATKNTDLIVLKMDAVRIAVRVRKNEYLNKYGNEFTIRKSRPSGNESELSKIISGWGDYFFYGFSDKQEMTLIKWSLIDLKIFRKWFNHELFKLPPEELPGIYKKNADNSSDFIAFECSKLPKNAFIGFKNAA